MAKSILERACSKYKCITHGLDKWLFPLLLLWVRLWMADIFWKSGQVKIQSWQSTLMLFEYEYKVPMLNHELAAYLATAFELACPILLTIGFMTRLAALPMLAMAVVIQFTYLDLQLHFFWMMILSLLILKGAGPISVDW
ncbi:MAG: DoxX family protein, partial [Alphaproteobacteria bacterium]|nr:DoxX family protein [Alphaproteobacteria bacterium]